MSEPVRQLRLVVTAADYDQALHFYRDVLGLPVRADFSSDNGRVTLLDAGPATIEIADPRQAEYIDSVEVGRRVAGHLRVAFEVDDAHATTQRLAEGGAAVVKEPTLTPWNSLNARLDTPGELHITVFQNLEPEE
jgi:lactoylglutathione lyase